MKIHFIGIGGIGVSALAQYYLAKGCQISGSDLVSSEIFKRGRSTFHHNDPKSLANEINYILENKDKVKIMTNNAYKELELFDVNSQVRKYIDIYRNIVKL